MSRKLQDGSRTKKEEQKQEQKRKQQKQGRHITIFAIVLGIVIILGILGVLIFQSGIIPARFPAVTIDKKNYKLCEFNYYYYAYYNSYLNDNSEYMDYMFDTSRSLKEQEYDENQSWFEYFKEQAAESMTSIIKTAELAQDAGYELSEEAKDEMEAVIQDIKSAAESAGVDTDEYLSDIYGRGMTLKLYKEHLTCSHLAAGYSDKLKTEYTFSDEEIKQYFDEHLEKYTFVNYERFYVKASDVDTEPTKQEKQDAAGIARQIYERVEKGEALKTVSEDYQAYGTYYSFDDAYYDASFSYGEWLFSAERKDGDVKVIEDGSGYYVMVFHSRDESSYKTADITDASFPVDAALEDSGADDYADTVNQLYEDSCTNAENLIAEWNAGEKTEESFQVLAQKYESASVSEGIYKNLTKDTLDDAIEEWVFDSSRKPGDCSVIYTESGFHAVYYSKEGEAAWKVQAEEDLRGEAHDRWYKDLLDTAAVKQHTYVLGFAGGEINK